MSRRSFDISAAPVAVNAIEGAVSAVCACRGWDAMSFPQDALVLTHQLKSAEGVLRRGDPGPE